MAVGGDDLGDDDLDNVGPRFAPAAAGATPCSRNRRRQEMAAQVRELPARRFAWTKTELAEIASALLGRTTIVKDQRHRLAQHVGFRLVDDQLPVTSDS